MMKVDFSNNNIKSWILLKSKELFGSARMSLREDTCELPGGRIINDYLVATLPAGAAVVAITEDKKIILVRQYKHGLSKIVLELPAGNVEKGEDPKLTISRELTEETGFAADDFELIAVLASKPARMTANTYIYFATGVKPIAKQKEDDAEIIEIVLVPLDCLHQLIKNGEIITETSLAALMVTWDRLYRQQEKGYIF